MHLRGGDHHPGGAARIQQGKEPLAERLMGEVVHGDGELVALGGTAWFGGPGLLEAGIEHQGVDRGGALEQLGGAARNAGQVGEIADGSMKARGFAGALRQQPLHGGRRGGLVPARQGEGMARLEQEPCRLEADARTGTGKQDAPGWLGSRRWGGHGGTLCKAHPD